MRQFIKYMSLATLLLFCMTGTKAAGGISVEASNGTVTSSVSNGICTLTVTPARGYYITINNITVVKYLDASHADSRTRADGPSVSENIAVSGQDPDDLSQRRNYTFTMPDDEYDVKVTAIFQAQTAITLNSFSLSTTEYTYDGTSKTPELTATGLTAGKDYTYEYINNVNAGTASVVITGISTYRTTLYYNYTIVPAELTVIADDNSKEYGDADPELTYRVTGLIGNDYLSGTLVRERGENVGNYNILQGSLSASANYTINFTGGTFSITQKNVTNLSISINDAELVYDGTQKRPSVTVYDGQTAIPRSEYTIEYENNINAGDALLTVMDAEGGNYTLNSTSLTFRINQAQLTVTADDKTKEYGAQDPELTYQTTGLVEGESLTGSMTRDEGEEIGTYPIKQGTLTASRNYNLTFVEGTFSITKKSLSGISVSISEEEEYVYDGKEKRPSVSVRNGDETLEESEYTISYSDNINAGTATVTVNSAESSKYLFTGSATFTIAKAKIEWKTIPSAKDGIVYNGEPQKLMRVGTAAGGVVEYSLDGSSFSADNPTVTDAGEYEVWYRLNGEPNYENIEPASTTVTIAQAEQEITRMPTALALTYNGEPQALIEGGEAKNGEMQYSLDGGSYSAAIPTGINAQNYDVWYRVEGHKNYKSIEASKLTVRIARAGEPSFAAPTGKNLVYTGESQELVNAGTAEGGEVQYSIDGANYGTGIPTGTLPQDYTIWYRVTGDQNHENIEPASMTVTIGRAPLTIKADDKIITDGDPIPELTYQFIGLVNGEDASVVTAPSISTDATAESGVGFYEITVDGGSATNYDITHVNGKLTISPTLKTEGGEDVSGHITENAEGEVSATITGLPEDTFTSPEGVPVTEDGRLDIPTSVVGSDGDTYPVTEVSSEVFTDMSIAIVVVLPEGISTSESVPNVINGDGTCQEMNVSEVQSLDLPIVVEVETVVYEREVTQESFTVCLPYDVPVPEGYRAYSLKQDQGGSALFDEVSEGTLTAYQPYVLVAIAPASARKRSESGSKTTINLSGSNAIIDPNRPDETVETGDLKIFGCITGLTHAEGLEKQAYIMQEDLSWKMTASSAPEDAKKVYLAPFQAYMCSVSSTPIENIGSDFTQSPTYISTPVVNRVVDNAYYDLHGRKIDGEPSKKGIYIKGGKKIIK